MTRCTILLTSALLVALLLGAPPRATAEEPSAPARVEVRLEFVYLTFAEFESDALAATAARQVQSLDGVRSFTWTAPRAEAKVVRVVGQADTPTVVALLARHGLRATPLPVSMTSLTFQRQLHCNGCVIKVKRALMAVAGTKEVSVSEDRRAVTITHDPKRATLPLLREALVSVHYPATE